MNASAQKEASNWFFGNTSGIKFMDNGSIQPLTGSGINTSEGCSTISDADGNLLFYTDGRNVWDRNHVLMPNGNYAAGTGLMGDPSSTQSAIIVPKKDDPDIYYIFTVDEPHHQNAAVYPNPFPGPYSDPAGTVPADDDGRNNGLNFSIVDLSITGSNGSIGDVVTRNVHLVTYNPANINEAKYKCSEKVTATINQAETGYWVITHFIDKFYAFEVTAAGVNSNPVVTQISPVVPLSGYRRNSIGCIKVSPNSRKIAIAHSEMGTFTGGTDISGGIYLYNFDNATGAVSNAVTIRNNITPYGVEFSPKSQKLYVSYDFLGIYQYDLLSDDIPASGVTLEVVNGSAGSLQLGPDGKIYRARQYNAGLDVINNPDVQGWQCNYQPLGVIFGGSGFAMLGLPPFITSFFATSITYESNCVGQATLFELNSETPFESVSWNFGDGSPPASGAAPSHAYTTAGTYNVVATVVRNGVASTVATQVTIYNMPVANTAPNLTQCPGPTGTALFDLGQNTNDIMGAQSPVDYVVLYFTSQADADNYTNFISDPSNYANTSNPQTIYARIHNGNNFGCYATTSFQISIASPVLTASAFAICDNDADGNDANGRTTFDLDAVTAQLVQNSSQYTTTYYTSVPNAQNEINPLPQLFYNTTASQQVVQARIVNISNPSCFAILPVSLVVNALPAAVSNANLVACDFDSPPDGTTQFNLNDATVQLTGGAPGMIITFYPTADDAGADTNPLPAMYTNIANPQEVYARITIVATGCYRIVPLSLQVFSTVPPPAVTLEECDNDGDVDGFTLFDLTAAVPDITGATITFHLTANDAAQEQNFINSDFTNTITNLQTVYARIDSNTGCAQIQEIILKVIPAPDIDTEDEAFICRNATGPITIYANVSGDGYTYLWSTGANTSSIQVNQPGVYSVTVENALGCETLRTITVSFSDEAVIDDIIIDDLHHGNNNRITIIASAPNGAAGDYLYSIDLPNGPYQESNVFENVAPGQHTVYIYDSNGCGIISKQILVLFAPKFFTPNGDGVNDTWRIVGLNSTVYANSTVHIFDRYGKLVAEPDPGGPGWDGTFNGYRLPATDYWYAVKLDDGREVKGHFSMIR